MLKDKLLALKAASADRIPPKTQAIMQKAKDDLAASGILENTIKAGERVADFSLFDAAGNCVELADLRRQGPVLISIYRGIW